ncbi:MAG TPA: hypothetical protein VE524_00990 [Nitrososphaeraceae archaeon]|nr:hypothetical protein [Nitrososphaeraceae archaeon]
MTSINPLAGQITLSFRILTGDEKNRKEEAKATFQYKYYPEDDHIEYIDTIYTHPKLQSMIEDNQKMMENVDSYIRKSLITNTMKKSKSR